MISPGRFITFEGGEGAGKSTQLGRLARALADAGLMIVETREPGGTPGAEEIRGLFVTGTEDRWDPVTELLLVTAARRDHVRNLIRPALEKGSWVLCDRFLDSTVAYQGYGHGVEIEDIVELHERFIGGLMPDLTFVLDVPVRTGLGRSRGGEKSTAGGSEDRFERIGNEFHDRLRAGFHEIVRNAPDRCVLIDTSSDTGAVASLIRRTISERFGTRFISDE